MIDNWDADDLDRRIGTRVRTVNERFAAEASLLAPPPDADFELAASAHDVAAEHHLSLAVNGFRRPIPPTAGQPAGSLRTRLLP
jgi:hypothetical protein